jgi:hypothetical protein
VDVTTVGPVTIAAVLSFFALDASFTTSARKMVFARGGDAPRRRGGGRTAGGARARVSRRRARPLRFYKLQEKLRLSCQRLFFRDVL